MHSIETLKGFQLQTSHEGTSYQTKIRKNCWTNITWEVSMWQRDNMSYAQHKLQKHGGCSPLKNLEIFIFKKKCCTSVCARLLCPMLWHRHGWRAENRWMLSTQKKNMKETCFGTSKKSEGFHGTSSLHLQVIQQFQWAELFVRIFSLFFPYSGPKQLGTRRAAANGRNINQP